MSKDLEVGIRFVIENPEVLDAARGGRTGGGNPSASNIRPPVGGTSAFGPANSANLTGGGIAWQRASGAVLEAANNRGYAGTQMEAERQYRANPYGMDEVQRLSMANNSQRRVGGQGLLGAMARTYGANAMAMGGLSAYSQVMGQMAGDDAFSPSQREGFRQRQIQSEARLERQAIRTQERLERQEAQAQARAYTFDFRNYQGDRRIAAQTVSGYRQTMRDQVAETASEMGPYRASRYLSGVARTTSDQHYASSLRQKSNQRFAESAVGRFFGAPNPMGLYFAAQFGAHEVAGALGALGQGRVAEMRATNAVEGLNAQVSAVQAGFGGILGSAGGLALDVFGRGPTSLGIQAGEAGAMAESQQRRRMSQLGLTQARRQAGIGGDTTSAIYQFRAASEDAANRLEAVRRGQEGQRSYYGSIPQTQLSRLGAMQRLADGNRYSPDKRWDQSQTYLYQHEDNPAYAVAQNALGALDADLESANVGRRQADRRLADQMRRSIRDTRYSADARRAESGEYGEIGDPAGAEQSRFYSTRSVARSVMRTDLLDTLGPGDATNNALGAFDAETGRGAMLMGRGRFLSLNQQSLGNSADRFAMQGFSRDAVRAGANAQFNVNSFLGRSMFGNVGQGTPEYAQIYDQYQNTVQRGMNRINGEDKYLTGMEAASDLTARRRPYDARRRMLRAEFERNTEWMSPDSDEYKAQARRYDTGYADIDTAQIEDRRAVGIGLDTRGNVLSSRRNRDAAGARASATGGAYLSEMNSLTPVGRELAIRAGRQGVEELELQRRDYLEGFRGRQVDLRNVGVDNPRDRANPEAAIKTITSQIQTLQDAITTALKELAAGG